MFSSHGSADAAVKGHGDSLALQMKFQGYPSHPSVIATMSVRVHDTQTSTHANIPSRSFFMHDARCGYPKRSCSRIVRHSSEIPHLPCSESAVALLVTETQLSISCLNHVVKLMSSSCSTLKVSLLRPRTWQIHIPSDYATSRLKPLLYTAQAVEQ